MKIYMLLIYISLAAMCLYANTACTVTQLQAAEDAFVKPDQLTAQIMAAPQVVTPKLAWKNDAWTKAALSAASLETKNFDAAVDMKYFCPEWKGLKDNEKALVITTLTLEVARHESAFNPKAKYQEPKPPKGPGTLSAGLLQISIGDSAYGGRCKALTAANLYDPVMNLECGIHMMGSLVAKDGYIAKGKDRATCEGLPCYWSVAREGHHIDEIKKAVNALSICKER